MTTAEYTPVVIKLTHKSTTVDLVTTYPKAAVPYLKEALLKTFPTITAEITGVEQKPIPEELSLDILKSACFDELTIKVFRQQELLWACEDLISSQELIKRALSERDEKDMRCRYLGRLCEKETLDEYMDTMLAHGFECLNQRMEIVTLSDTAGARESHYVRLNERTRSIPLNAFERYAFRNGHDLYA